MTLGGIEPASRPGPAGALDLRAVAEGIETVEQTDLLRGMGCDFGQGHLYARPMPLDDDVEWMRGPLATALLP